MNLNTKSIYYCGGKIILTDFGLVTVENQRSYIPMRENPILGYIIPSYWINYQAPEIFTRMKFTNHGFESKMYSKKSDIFAFGYVFM